MANGPWIEGSFDEHGCPKVPWDHPYIWLVTDSKYVGMRPMYVESIEFSLMSRYSAAQERGDPVPRWWYLPIPEDEWPDPPKELPKKAIK